MRIAFFVHAIASCWNNGNAHFLRGVVSALQQRGHDAVVYEPASAWSRENLLADHGSGALDGFARAFPRIRPLLYDGAQPDLDRLLHGADLVVVHEWNDPSLVNAIGRMRSAGGRFTLLFHDTHHRAATSPDEMARFDLSGYDGVLAFGAAIGELYEKRGWARRVWTWHEAADTTVFYPRPRERLEGDLVWVGNWGDEERSEEIRDFLLEPSRDLRLRTNIYGVRYPAHALDALSQHGVHYRGWLANHLAPQAFANHRVTVHVPRRPYARALPGVPTIRVFEALACGIPLVSAPWDDSERLFPEGAYLQAASGAEMRRQLRAVLHDPDLVAALVETGLRTVRSRHTCAHRAEELLDIAAGLGAAGSASMRKIA